MPLAGTELTPKVSNYMASDFVEVDGGFPHVV